MCVFHPDNNLGVEIFAIGVIAIVVFTIGFMIWYWYTDRKWKRRKK